MSPSSVFLSKCLPVPPKLKSVRWQSQTFITSDVDADAAAQNEATAVAAKTKKTKGASGGMPHERLSVALLTSLPDIFVKFKGDNTVLGSITILPRYICEF